MKRKIVNGLLLMALSVSSVSTFVACKDYDEDMNLALRGQITKESSLREALEKQVAELKAFAEGIKQCECQMDLYLKKSEAENLYLKKGDLDGYLNEVAVKEVIQSMLNEALDAVNKKLENYATKGDLEAVAGDVEKLKKEIVSMNETITKVEGLAKKAQELAEQNKIELDGLGERVAALEGLAAGLPATFEDIYAKLAETNATLVADKAAIEANTEAIEALRKLVANLPAGSTYDDTAIKNRLTTLEGQMGEAQQNITKLLGFYNDLTQKVTQALDDIADLKTTVGKMEERLTDAEENIKKLREDVDYLLGEVERLDKEINLLKKDLQNMITSITVQAAESPVLGYANTPLGLNATVLAVYYGKADSKFDFPATNPDYYLNKEKDFALWKERNMAAIGGSLADVSGYLDKNAGDVLVTGDGEEGNAGTLYLTINPANVDFTESGKPLKLVDSQDNPAPATLSLLKYSDRTLSFGYTRAEKDKNGFYEAAATITADDVENAKMNLDFNTIADDIKTLLNERTTSSVLDLGATIVRNLSDVLPAYGVMASWTDESEGKEHKLYSQYNVAATAIKPLSFEIANAWPHISSMPGLDRLENLVGQIIDKVNVDLKLNLPDFSKYKDFKIEFKDVVLNGDDLKIKLQLSDTDGNVFIPVVSIGDNGDVALVQINDGVIGDLYLETDGTYKKLEKEQWGDYGFTEDGIMAAVDSFLEIDLTEQMQDTLNDVVESLGKDINGTLKDLFNDIAAIGDLDGTISGSIADAKNDIKSAINGYISRINDKLTKWINRAPNMVNLTMVANAGNKIGILSQSKANPTKATGAVTLFPTTYNLELLVPTYKKYVAVTDVFNPDGSNADIQLAKDANNGKNLNKVIDGNTTCTLAGKTDYIYEVTYTAVDYAGHVAIRKYYVKF